MKSEIKVLRTEEIDNFTWKQICNGYEVCFGINCTPEQLKKSFSNTISGYTLHAVKLSLDGTLMGHNYYQPKPYILNGKEVVCALSGGTFVMPEYRNDIFIFNEMVKALDKEATALGWIAQLGVPNENSFKYAVKINKQKYIGDLSYYILPVRLANILGVKFTPLNFLSRIYSCLSFNFNRLFSHIWNNKEKIKPLHLDVSVKYLDMLYGTKSYIRIEEGDIVGIYRIYIEKGNIRTAYITYFAEKQRRSYKALCTVVKNILRKEKVDAIIYIGTLNFAQGLLTKVPEKYVPQKLPLCVTLLDKKNSEMMKICESMNNIDFGLINFDVR